MKTLFGNSKIGGFVAAKDGSVVWQWADPARQAAAEARARGEQRAKPVATPRVDSRPEPDFREAVADALERRMGRGAHASKGLQIQGAPSESMLGGIVDAMDRERGINAYSGADDPLLPIEDGISADTIERALATRGGESQW